MTKLRGGASIGWVNATAPLASIETDGELLTLAVLFIGRYEFRKDQVTALREHRGFLGLSRGIRIDHVVPDFPAKLTFWTVGSPSAALVRIEEAGFTPKAQAPTTPLERGSAFRWPTLVTAALAWNGLFLLDRFRSESWTPAGWGLGLGPMIAVGTVFAFSAGVRGVKPLQWILLKNGRSLVEVRHWINLLTLVSGMMTLFMLTFALIRHHAEQ